MARVMEEQGQMVFGLDIGTRSIVGTAGYIANDGFHVVAQCIKEHDTRAMLDGQIHDIAKVAETISYVKEEMEENLNKKLTEVCIAAAGRVLKTVTTHVEQTFEFEREVVPEDVFSLSTMGIEKAYDEFTKDTENNLKFYCVGYTPMRYYLNGYPIGNLEGHKAGTIAADLIATFLPDDVVDGLYKAVEKADLKVVNLTLEPIAAINLAIPDKFRMLNMALVDVGAGTSDTCITKDGMITAYGMIPVAGDSITNVIMQHYLVEFDTAEQIKRQAGEKDTVEFTDVIGLVQKVKSKEVIKLVSGAVKEMAELAANEILRLNGEKAPGAVFVVGGGGVIDGYVESLAAKLDMPKERVVIRGSEVMQNITFENKDARNDSLMVTPIGICLTYYEQSNNFIFVDFNRTRVKLYDNGKLTVAEAAMQAQFPNEQLFPRRGKALTFTVNGKSRILRGTPGEAAIIEVNGERADMYTQIKNGDVIRVTPSTEGESASMELNKVPEMGEKLSIQVNESKVEIPKVAFVNGARQNEFYKICDGDEIDVHNYFTVKEIAEFIDVPLGEDIMVNETPAKSTTKVYEGFSVSWDLVEAANQQAYEMELEAKLRRELEEKQEESEKQNASLEIDSSANETGKKDSKNTEAKGNKTSKEKAKGKKVEDKDSSKTSKGDSDNEAEPVEDTTPKDIVVIVNRQAVHMSGKPKYVYVDVFEYIQFDLKESRGRAIVTTLNGKPAEYMEEIKDGDIIEIYWKERSV